MQGQGQTLVLKVFEIQAALRWHVASSFTAAAWAEDANMC